MVVIVVIIVPHFPHSLLTKGKCIFQGLKIRIPKPILIGDGSAKFPLSSYSI